MYPPFPYFCIQAPAVDQPHMAKKRKLHIALSPAEFRAIGIFADQKDYRLCWHLNRHLHTDLRRLPDFYYPPANRKEDLPFAVFHYEDAPLMMRYFLVANKSAEGPLLSEPKNLDFLLLLRQPSDQFDPPELIRRLRKVPSVKAAVLLDNMPDKRTVSFFYDFEMYVDRLT